MADFTKIPLIALSSNAKFLLSSLLNPPKVIPSCEGIPRDWRGLADLFDLGGEIIPSIANHPDPTERILHLVTEKDSKITINFLEIILEKMDRWDVIDDAKSLFEKDAKDYEERMDKCQLSADTLNNEIDNQMLTIDDLYRIRAGLTIQFYDAFLLCADEDASFAEEMIQNLEQKYNLKLCVKDRDLISGATFEHEAVMQLISERCNRLLVVLSPNFLNSPANKFFLNYAQAVGIEKRQRKIIPCLYKKCTPPPQLMYTFILDYNKSRYYDFWGRLRDSIASVNSEITLESNVTLQKNPVIDIECLPPTPEVPKGIEALKTITVNQSPKKSSKFFSWSQKNSMPKQQRDSENKLLSKGEVSIPILPSLDGLDSLQSSSIDDTPPRKEKKKTVMKACAKKIKSLVVKS
ncbi:hypothetical protein PV326_014051 [Microctonus aethiopoides]|uniref:Myeloid differentiation primary response protein MyD88 n=1 Tax=Microctonus aethiopoides TaxID=144406 RepID=A0AA39KRJ0_9HYME|nr:hypothetical protein PV326_014051 [Microctonus aethiopoides]KAK0171087.1 hypothetical protein PV328_008849 [Microctonus aethiopoides]